MKPNEVLAIIPSIGGPGYKAVSDLQRKLAQIDSFESIVVSNAKSLSKLLDSESIPYVTRNSNDGFGQSVKVGAESSESWSWILIVNDDVSFEADKFAKSAHEHLVKNRGFLEIVYFDADKLRRLPRRIDVFFQVSLLGKFLDRFRSVEVNEAESYRSFSCVAISRDLFDLLGGFDDDLVFTYEDADFVSRSLAFHAVQRCVIDSGVVHAHSVSSGKHVDSVLPVATYSAAKYLDKIGSSKLINSSVIILALIIRVFLIPFTRAVMKKHISGIYAAARAVLTRSRTQPRLPNYMDL